MTDTTKKTPPTATADIVRSMVQVKMTVRKWGGRAKDSAAAREVEKTRGQSAGTADVSIRYLSDAQQHAVGTAWSQLRTIWQANTLPWEDGGHRIVTAEGYLPLLDMVAPYVQTFNDIADDMDKRYDEIKAEAKASLNGAFSEDKFPTREQLRARYGVDIKTRAVHLGNDIRIEGLSDAAQETIRKGRDAEIGAQLNAAVSEIGERLVALVHDMKDRVDKRDQEGQAYGGLQKVAARVCDGLAKLNVTGDARIAKLVADVRMAVAEVDGKKLRTNAKARLNTKSALTTIESDLANVFGS